MKNVNRLVGRLTLFFWTLETGKACSASRSSHDVLVALAIAFTRWQEPVRFLA
jgi:hypothetical protein